MTDGKDIFFILFKADCKGSTLKRPALMGSSLNGMNKESLLLKTADSLESL